MSGTVILPIWSGIANRATARMLLSRFEEARRDFERALEIDPSLDEVRRNLGSLYLHTGKAEEAVRLFGEIRQEDVRRGVPLQLAAAFLDLEKPAEARRVLESAIKDQPTAADSLLMRDLLLVAWLHSTPSGDDNSRLKR